MPRSRQLVGASAAVPGVRPCRLLRPVAEPARTAHFHATGHPIMEGYDPPEGWGWCYADGIEVDLPDQTPQIGPIPRFF